MRRQCRWYPKTRARGRMRTCQFVGQVACFQRRAIVFIPYFAGLGVALQLIRGWFLFAGITAMDVIVLARRCPVVAGSDYRMTAGKKLGSGVQDLAGRLFTMEYTAHSTSAKGR